MIAGATFAFITSFDELVVSLFLTGPRLSTLPVQIYNYIEFASDPTIAAISVLLIAFTTAVVLLVERVVGFTAVLCDRRNPRNQFPTCRGRAKGSLTMPCPHSGINGGEFPHWSVAEICGLAVKLRAQFVELSGRRSSLEGAAGGPPRDTAARGLGVHVNAGASELAPAFATAHALKAPVIVVFDDAIRARRTPAGGRVSTTSVALRSVGS